ncbi:MAG TPA: ferritin family protein [archaeon]|nr:ferritin family protein [archaeon]
MNIFDYAMQMEKDGERYYREIAGKTRNKGLAAIMNLLADEEVKHYEILKEMRTRTPKMAETEILKNVKNVFVEMRDSKESFQPGLSQTDMYKKAQGIEKKSMDFYQEKSEEVSEPAQKEILKKLADEEKRHFFILENIITFVSRPHTWLENAEFNQLEEY